MVTLEKCRSIFAKHGYHYTDEQLKKIHEFMYLMATIEYNSYQRSKKHEQESNHLRKGSN